LAGMGERKMPTPKWCLAGLTKTQRRRLQKMRQAELAEKREEDVCDKWFNQARPMTGIRKTWREQCLAREENVTDSDDS
jgi:hypothetical protein